MHASARHKLFHGLACLLVLFSTQAWSEECLNPDSKRGTYSDGDPRNSTYVKCKPGQGSGTYGSLGAIGQQMQSIMGKSEDEPRREISESQRADVKEFDRLRFRSLRMATASEANLIERSRKVAVFPNANITPEAKQALREEIGAAIDSGQLLEKYGNQGYEKPWTSDADPAKNWKTCEAATQLVRAFVYGDFVKPEQKNPAKGFAIAQAGCTAQCGGTCYWLGRIFEDGDAVAPGVDKLLGKEPQKMVLQAYDIAIVNGVPGAYEREAEVNYKTVPRFKDKTYFNFSDFSSDNHYWFDIGDYTRLGYQQYKRCLEVEPANIVCARGINALIKEFKFDSPHAKKTDYYSPDADIRRDIDDKDIAYYKNYLAKLEGLLAGGKP